MLSLFSEYVESRCGLMSDILQVDPPPSKKDYKGSLFIYIRVSYNPMIPLLQGGGSLIPRA